jgi:hypothetical protein
MVQRLHRQQTGGRGPAREDRQIVSNTCAYQSRSGKSAIRFLGDVRASPGTELRAIQEEAGPCGRGNPCDAANDYHADIDGMIPRASQSLLRHSHRLHHQAIGPDRRRSGTSSSATTDAPIASHGSQPKRERYRSSSLSTGPPAPAQARCSQWPGRCRTRAM